MLTNARCLTEGVDVPTLDGVAFIDPRRSQVDVVQAVGRAIRKAEDKTRRHHRHPRLRGRQTPTRRRRWTSSRVRPRLAGRPALRDHDEDLAKQLDELRRELGRRGTVGERPGKIVLDLPVGVGLDFARAFSSRLAEESTQRWDLLFGMLLRYADAHGDARVPDDCEEGGYALGSWVVTQRIFRKKGWLARERARLLEAVPGWSWDPLGDRWADGYQRLRRFVAKRDCLPSSGFEDEEGFPLGDWVARQRRLGVRRSLDAERVGLLEQIPGWTWNRQDAAFEVGVQHLNRYVERVGHARPERGELDPDDRYPVGVWVQSQRYRARQSPGRARRLELLPGWTWNVRDAAWEQAFDALLQYATRTGVSNPPRNTIEDGMDIGAWVIKQRSRKRRLAESQRRRLSEVPGWTWAAYSDQWDDWYELLVRFAEREGHAIVSQKHVEGGRKLGVWVSGQRSAYRHGKLARSRVSRLETLPSWTWNAQKAAQPK